MAWAAPARILDIGGIAVGIASDKILRYDLNRDKRAWLVKAGADVIVPDCSQAARLTR